MDLLDYDVSKKQFTIPVIDTTPKFFTGCMEYDNFCLALEDTYPKNITGIRDLKKIWNNCKASDSALKRINEIKNLEASFVNDDIYQKHKELFKRVPYQHQIEAINRMLASNKLMLVLEQGLGKTFIAYMLLSILKAEGMPYYSLIICPKIVLPTWIREIREYTDLDVIDYYGTLKQRNLIELAIADRRRGVVVTTFDMLITEGAKKFLVGQKFDNVIVDEASRCINTQAKRSKAIQVIAEKAKRVYLMSGTLCLGRPTDIYMPANILDPTIINMNQWKFKNRYCTVSPYNKHIITGYKHIDELKETTDPFILSKTRAECIDLPDRIIERHYYELNPTQIRLYNDIVTEDVVVVEDDRIIHTELTVQKINKLLQCVSGFLHTVDKNDYICYKCKRIKECVLEGIQQGSKRCTNTIAPPLETHPILFGSNKMAMLLEDIQAAGDKKVIVWAWYRHSLENIRHMLCENKIDFTTPEEKNCVEIFNTNPKVRVFLGQTKQGIGITLNAAQLMIYYEHGADLEARLQSMDRNYRIGQSEKVVVYDYVCAGTIEDNMLTLLEHKNLVKEIMQSEKRCSFCSKFKYCLDNGTLDTAQNCRKYDGTKIAETKETLKITNIGG